MKKFLLSVGIVLLCASTALGGSFDPDSGCTIDDNISAYWKLEEASGDRADEVASNDLTSNNSVGQTTGAVGNAADFENSAGEDQYLSIADNATLSMSDEDFSVGIIVQFETLPSGGNQMGLIGKGNEQTAQGMEYYLRYNDGNDRFEFLVGNNSSKGTATASTFGAASTGVPYLVLGRYDSVANEVGISINAGTFDTASYSGGSYDSGDPLVIGRGLDQDSAYLDGWADEPGVWKGKVWTATEATDLYNSASFNTFDSSGTCTSYTPIFFF